MNKSMLNDVKSRFLSLPKSATEGLEHEPKKSDFNIIKELGMGSFGTVYLVSHKKTKAKYALKAIDKTVEENLEEKANFNREVEIMYKLNHPNIVKLYGHFEDEKYCYFIMQYIPNKSLFEIVPLPGQKPNIKLIASVMKDLISAVYYLHHMKPVIIHRDIKPENILLDQNHKAYLTDFGWSNYMPTFCRRTTICGTPLYLPPEMIEKSGHDETADIWCIGVLLFELITGQTPFKGEDINTVAHNIRKLNITWIPNMDPDAKDLISKILKLHGKDRLPIEQILSHKFFSQYFPNAVKELIKPESQKITTFVVSIDDPKDYGKQNRTNSTSTIENNEVQNKINTNASDIKKSNYRNSNYSNYNKINISNNSNVNNNKTDNKISIPIRATYVPRANIDLYKRNVKAIKKPNDKNITLNTSYNRNNITYDTKSYNKNNLRNTYITNSNTNKYVNKALSPSNNYNKNNRNKNNNLNNNIISSNNNRINTSRYSTINTNIQSNNNRINTSRYSTINTNIPSNNNRINTSRYSTINTNIPSNNNRINTSRYSTINTNNISSNNNRINTSRYSTINNNNNVHHRIKSNLINRDNKNINNNGL